LEISGNENKAEREGTACQGEGCLQFLTEKNANMALNKLAQTPWVHFTATLQFRWKSKREEGVKRKREKGTKKMDGQKSRAERALRPKSSTKKATQKEGRQRHEQSPIAGGEFESAS